MQNKDFHIKDILNYLGNKMSERDSYAFERRMEADPFLMDAVEGYQNMSPAEIEKQLMELRARIGQKKRARIVPVWMRAAAAVLILLGVGTLWMIDQRKQKTDFVSDRIEAEGARVEKDEPLVLSLEEEGEGNSVEESKDETQVEKDQTNVQDIKAVLPLERPTTKNSFVQARRMDQDDEGNDKKVLRKRDSMLGIGTELEERLASVEASKVVMDKTDKYKEVRIRGLASPRDTSAILFTGRVVDEHGIPLPGVSVKHSVWEGLEPQSALDNKVITDMDGNFKIKAPQSGAVLQLSFIGFKDKIAVAKNDSVGVLMMEPDQMALKEVAVIAHGIQTKKRNARNTTATKEEISMVESEDKILLPEPEGGIKKLVKRVERRLRYPDLPQGEKISVTVELFVSSKGEVIKVQAVPSLDDTFLDQLRDRLKAAQWTAPTINGMSIASSRKIVFEFAGER